jgi:hypothetical protein
MDKMQGVPPAGDVAPDRPSAAEQGEAGVGSFALIHGVDDLALAAELNRRAQERNLTQGRAGAGQPSDEATKHGAAKTR